MFSIVLPVLVSVACRLWLKPICTRPKPKLVGLSCTTVPVPPSETVWGLPDALSETVKIAVRVPRCVGLKAMLIVQLAPGVIELPQLLVW